jgi:hypothetical protein
MIEEAYCPACDAALGSTQGEVGIFCWKCGLTFGQTASTKPIIREKSRSRRYSAPWVTTAVVGPGLMYWAVIYSYPRMRIPSLGRLWMAPAGGLTLFGFGCVLYMVGWAAQSDRGGLWVVKAAMCSTVIVIDTVLLLMALIVMSR